MIGQFLLAQTANVSVKEQNIDLVLNSLNTFGNLKSTDAIPVAIDKLWQVTVINGNMYKVFSGLGLTIAIFAVGFWCVKFYKTLEEGGLRPAMNELILPLVLVVLLSNGGEKLRDMTYGTRNMMNSINRVVTKTVSSEIDLKTAIRTLAVTASVKDLIETGMSNCKAEIDSERLQLCIKRNLITVEFIKKVFSKLKDSNAAKTAIQSRADIEKFEQMAIEELKKAQEVGKKIGAQVQLSHLPSQAIASGNNATVPPTITAPPGNNTGQDLDLRSVINLNSSKNLRTTILAMRGAFIYIIEVTMLVTGLVGPIFVALSLFPSGSKFLLNWGASFLSLGFCKICYSLISGLSALAIVYAGTDSLDMIVVSLVLGIFAPLLSFGIASGSGIGVLSAISQVGQSYGVNTGMSGYSPKRRQDQGMQSAPLRGETT